MSRLYPPTEKEVEALQLLWNGLTQKQIAARLDVNRNTLTKRFLSVRRKLRAATMIQATRQAVKEGILQP